MRLSTDSWTRIDVFKSKFVRNLIPREKGMLFEWPR
jgi:hypothetical protein